MKIAFGTDVGGFDWKVDPAKEFGYMVKWGMTPMQAIRAATSTASELLGMQDRERSQHQRVDERENRRIGTDAERERGNDRKCEGGPALERSKRVAQIAHDGLQRSDPAHIAARFFHL